MRALFMKVNMHSRPLFGGPMRKPVAPSKFITQVAEALIPIFFSSAPQLTPLRGPSAPPSPGRNLGTMNREMPRVPFGASGRRARTMWTMFSVRSCSPEEMNIFVPLMA
ncbi:hypothetical protein ACS96_29840 [Pseudomonas aeruginosa]|nr:hypothetical protein ACS96_29825 [Pseudomonas aeruginosa]KMQ53289.1 hypothetical protein ACS96_29840 [Pseudomonas aeruginosa]